MARAMEGYTRATRPRDGKEADGGGGVELVEQWERWEGATPTGFVSSGSVALSCLGLCLWRCFLVLCVLSLFPFSHVH